MELALRKSNIELEYGETAFHLANGILFIYDISFASYLELNFKI